MKIEQQVCSLELAKRLNDLRVNRESYFQWRVNYDSNHEEALLTHGESYETKGEDVGTYLVWAFTVAELINLLQTVAKCDILVASTDNQVADTLAIKLIDYYAQEGETSG